MFLLLLLLLLVSVYKYLSLVRYNVFAVSFHSHFAMLKFLKKKNNTHYKIKCEWLGWRISHMSRLSLYSIDSERWFTAASNDNLIEKYILWRVQHLLLLSIAKHTENAFNPHLFNWIRMNNCHTASANDNEQHIILPMLFLYLTKWWTLSPSIFEHLHQIFNICIN